jgi:prolyl oligopeptidase
LAKFKYPSAKKTNHTDTYFNTDVPDPYSWMEDMQSADVKDWIKEENLITENYLNEISYREKINKRLTELWNYPRFTAPQNAGEYFFFYKNDGLQNQSVLFRQKGLEGEPEIFIDPNEFSSDGTVSLDETSFSWDNKYFAYSISREGSDWNEIYVIEVDTKKKLNDRLDWVKFCNANWFGDGFFYNRYDQVSGDIFKEINQNPKIYFHKVGTDQSQDKLIYEDSDHPERFAIFFTTEDQSYLFKYVTEKGTDGNSLYYRDLNNDDLKYKPISDNFENKFYLIDSGNDEIYLMTDKGASNYKLIKFIPSTGIFTDLIPESENVIVKISFVQDKFIVEYLSDGYSKVIVYDKNGLFINEIAMPSIGSAIGFSGRKTDKEIFYNFTSFSHPSSIYKYELENKTSVLYRKSMFDFNSDDYISKQIFYASKDGTKIPLFLVHKKGLELNGTNPTLLNGYGGFNNSETPNFSSIRRIFLENGGVYAVACLRGGGEYGEEWHRAGMQFNKQNVYDDFISAAEYLINEKYTSSEKLAVHGRSNGGLLIGAVINQRPELFKAAIPAVGVMDMLKFHLFTIGWSWQTEYGSIEVEEHFKNLFSYSPLHNIKAQNYPATLIITSDHDDRVVPLHSYKYAAALQEKNTGDNPVLIRIATHSGHGAGTPTSKSIEELTDFWSFVFYNLGINY